MGVESRSYGERPCATGVMMKFQRNPEMNAMTIHRLIPFLALSLTIQTPTSTTRAQSPHGLESAEMIYLDRYSAPTLSPDGRVLVFSKRVIDRSSDKASSSLWTRNLVTRDNVAPRQISPDGWSVSSPSFSPDGRRLYFLSAKSGKNQLYSMPVSGGPPEQLTDFGLDVADYKLSPNGSRVALAFSVLPECDAELSCTADFLRNKEAGGKTDPVSSGMLFDSLFIRHWDTWNEGLMNRVFVADMSPSGPVRVTALLSAAIAGDIPSRPFGDLSDLAWSPDGSKVAMSIRLANREEPWSTNFDIWLVDSNGGSPRNLTASNPAWDASPVFSADGKTLYYRAMKRPGFEADRFALMAMDIASGESREIAPQWDRSADGIVLSPDGKYIYTTAQDMGQNPLFKIDVASGSVSRVVADGSVGSVRVAGSTLAFTRNSLNTGDVVYVTDLDARAPLRAITPDAAAMLPDVAWAEWEQFSFTGWNGETVHAYVLKPWNYQPGNKYPVAFLIHGGPQGSFGNSWSYRWNPQTYAGQGYAVVMVDFHGSTGYGQSFTDAISGHWGDRPLEDLQKGWSAALERYSFLDGDRACALGASYGGFMAYWIAGNWNTPWKCIVAHDGVFDNFLMGYATEELWFSEWENGGTPYDNPSNYQRFNPANHVKDWRVPILIIHSQQDFRIPVEQGVAAFTAAQRRGIESKFLYFPDENHWVLKPANSQHWHETVMSWLDSHTRK